MKCKSNELKIKIIISALKAYITYKPTKYIGDTKEIQKSNISCAQMILATIENNDTKINNKDYQILYLALVYYGELLNLREIISCSDIYLIDSSDSSDFEQYENLLLYYEKYSEMSLEKYLP